MNSTRIEQLLEFITESPEDPFLRYALALEYVREKPVEARQLFDHLLENHPEYVPAYYHAAALYDAQGDRDLALKTYETGMEKARQQNESLALRELRNAYDLLLFED